MNILELKNQIMKNDLSNLYIFEGEEIGIINIYLNQISKVTGLPITRCETVVTALNSCRSGSLFGNSKGLYVVRNDKDVTKEEKHYSEIKNRRILTRIDLKTYLTGTNTSLPPI